MRLQFDEQIILCKKVEYHSCENKILLITSVDDEVYMVKFPTNERTSQFYFEMLRNGYVDLTDYYPVERKLLDRR